MHNRLRRCRETQATKRSAPAKRQMRATRDLHGDVTRCLVFVPKQQRSKSGRLTRRRDEQDLGHVPGMVNIPILARMEVMFIASIALIAENPADSRKLFV